MKNMFLVLCLGMVFFSFASASVNEYNYFRLGELDSNRNLIETATPVNGVNVLGFSCSVLDCSASSGDLWGGELYSATNGINLVYPTVLVSPNGYGLWFYKTGYVPYWVKGITWYGTGDVPDVNRYLSQKQDCVTEVAVASVSEVGGALFIEVTADVDSPIIENYGSIYLPAEIVPHLSTLAGITAEVRNINGQLVWTQRLERNIGYSGAAVFPFYLALEDGSYTVTVISDMMNEDKCAAYTSDSDSSDFVIGSGETLVIDDLTCFPSVTEDANQSCSVSVEDGSSSPVGSVLVDVYYSSGALFGSCVTDSISGACAVLDIQDSVGDFEVYAHASRTGFNADVDGLPTFSYSVLASSYDVVDLKIYNDFAFTTEDYDFFRGENMYVSFAIEDLNGAPVVSDMISSVTLVSSVAGGMVALDRLSKSGNVYEYRLVPIPTTHDFIGGSNVFSFVFDIVGGGSGQEQVSLMIRNNVPEISPSISSRTVEEDDDITVNLASYEEDVEDSGSDLTWSIVSFGSDVDVRLSGKVLTIEGLNEGDAEVVVRLTDLDGDYDEQTFDVEVEEEGDDDDDDDDCTPRWECSPWDECDGDIQTRACVDARGCGTSRDMPAGIRECSGGDLGSNAISLGDFSAASNDDESSGFSIWWIIWALGILALLVLIWLIFLLLR